jgi:hypothetical protein
VPAAPAPRQAAPRPPRILLWAGAANREYQFLRAFFIRQAEKGRAELTICLQKRSPAHLIVPDVLPDRLLKEFPTRLVEGEKADAGDTGGNLARYDVLLGVDPDWAKLTEKQGQLVRRWLRQPGRGLILVAGALTTGSLGRPADARRLKAVLDVLPVRVGAGPERVRETDKPCRLVFKAAEGFLALEGKAGVAPAGWSRFFGAEHGGRPARGFYSCAPVQAVKPDATVLAVFHDPDAPARKRDVPYLVTMPCGKGRTVYLGSGESWRLRAFREEFYERFWAQLTRYAASAPRRRRQLAKP